MLLFAPEMPTKQLLRKFSFQGSNRGLWQRGSNEYTIGLLRQYLPKGTDISFPSEEELAAIAKNLNTRPRQTLDWMTPSKKFFEVIATTG